MSQMRGDVWALVFGVSIWQDHLQPGSLLLRRQWCGALQHAQLRSPSHTACRAKLVTPL